MEGIVIFRPEAVILLALKSMSDGHTYVDNIALLLRDEKELFK